MTAMFSTSRRAFVAGLGAASAIGLCPAGVRAQSGAGADLTAFLNAEFEDYLRMNPRMLTSLGRKELYDQLGDFSEADDIRQLEWRRRSVAAMKSRFNPAALDQESRTSFDLWALSLDRSERSDRWRRHGYIFGRNGPHTSLPTFLINQHRVDTAGDMSAYIARIEQLGPAMDQLAQRVRAAAADGVRMPRFAYDQTLDEIKRLTTGAPFTARPDSAVLADARAKIAALKASGEIADAQAARFETDIAAAMTGSMQPAYERLAVLIAAERALTPAEARGVGALPDGAAYYDDMLYLQTTTDMTAPEIHALGLSEVARLRDEMEALKGQVGFAGSLQDFFAFMRADDRFYLPDTDAGREQYLQRARDHLAQMEGVLPHYFGRLPKAPLEVRRVEAFREEPGGAQHYQSAAPDGSRPGIFYAHLSDMRAMPLYQLEVVAYHEGLPGHHMQISIARELTDVPTFRTTSGYTAYSEGWGLYSEALAKEMGFFTDPYSDFGRLSTEIWRAIRLVVDTGLHAQGWSEEQAVAYFLENSPQAEGAVRSEIRRYIVTPGQATCYKIGMIRIQAARDQARAALGDRFDYRQFHDTVLAGGALPMPVLQTRVADWTASLLA